MLATLVAMTPHLLAGFWGAAAFMVFVGFILYQVYLITSWAWLGPILVYAGLAIPGYDYNEGHVYQYACGAVLLLMRPFYLNPHLASVFHTGKGDDYDIYKVLLAGWLWMAVVTAAYLWAVRAPLAPERTIWDPPPMELPPPPPPPVSRKARKKASRRG